MPDGADAAQIYQQKAVNLAVLALSWLHMKCPIVFALENFIAANGFLESSGGWCTDCSG